MAGNAVQHQEDLNKLRAYLAHHPRDLLLFEFLMMGELTIRQILELKFKDVAGIKEGSPLPVTARTGREAPVVTPFLKRAYDLAAEYNRLRDDDYLFKSRKAGKQLSVTSVSRLARGWLKKTNLTGYKSIHDLRAKFDGCSTSINQHSKPSALDSLPAVKNLTVQEQAYKELAKNILNGAIPPGQKLFPEKIARRMEISTTPVREALRCLEVKGFVLHNPKRGWVVSKLSRDDLREILDVRLLLECEAIYRAATKIGPDTLNGLKRAQKDFEKANIESNPSESLKANRRFHMLAYQDVGSRMMLKIISQLWDLLNPYYEILFRQSLLPKPTVGVNNHLEIVRSLEAKEPEQAKFWLKEDIIKPSDFVFKLFELYQNSFE